MRNEITRLKKRRDELLHRACIRQELPAIMREVQAINRRLADLERRSARHAERNR